jgi:hypothetical protein
VSEELNVAVQANRKQRQAADPAYLRSLERARQMVAEQDAEEAEAKKQEAAKASALAAQPAVKDAPMRERSGDGVLVTTGKQVIGGMADAVKEIVDLAEEGYSAAAGVRMDSSKWSDAIPTTDKADGAGYGAVRGISQFLLPFGVAMKGLSGVYKASKILKPMAVGAGVDFAAFDPHEKRLSNLIEAEAPWASSIITEYLQSEKDDTWLEGRLKNAGEGAFLGVAAEAAFKMIKGAAKHFKSTGRPLPPAEKVEPAMPAQPQALPAPGTPTSKVAAGAPGDDLGALVRQKIEQDAVDRAARIQAERAAEDTRVTDAFRAQGMNRDGTPLKAVEENVDDVASRGMKTPNTDAGDGLDPGVRTGTNADGVPTIEINGAAPVRQMPEPWEIDGGLPPRVEAEFEQVLTDFVSGTPRRAYVDPDNGVITMSRERPDGPSVIDMDRRVEDALSRPGVERTAEDLVILRAYRQMQEKTLEAFQGSFKVETPSAPKLDAATRREALTPLTVVRDRKGALTDAERIAIREQGEELTAKIAKNAEDLRKVDEVINRMTRGRNIGGRGQGGYISPSLLMNLGAGAAGAGLGLATADADATFGERLDRAGLFAAGALGVKVGTGKLLGEKRAAREAAQKESDEIVASLAKPEHAGIRPRPQATAAAPATPRPKFPKAKVVEMADAFARGDERAIAAGIDESDFNFANLDSSADVKTTIDAFSAEFEKEITQAKRGVRTLQQQQDFARELGTDVKTLKAQYEAMGFAAERAVAHRAFLMASAQKTRDLADLVKRDPTNVDTMLAFRKQVTAHAEVQAYMKGITTEAGRLLGSFRIRASASQFKAAEVQAMLDSLGGLDANADLAAKLSGIADPAKFNAAVRKGALARTADAIFESVVNGILSGPKTFVVNVLGNGLIPFVNATEKAIAAGVGAVRPGAKGDRYRLAEAELSLRGFYQGAMDSVRLTSEGRGELADAAARFAKGDIAGAEAIITGSSDIGPAVKSLFNKQAYTDAAGEGPAEALTKQMSITAGNFNLSSASTLGHIVDYAGAITRTPGRMLMMTDEFFKSGLYRGELRALSYRKAMDEGLTGDAFNARVADLLENPTPAMSESAIQQARLGTFTNDLGAIGGALQKLVLVTPGLRYIMPFVKTPINILNYVGERTPLLNAYSKRVRDDWAAGGAKRDMVVAQSVFGSALYVAAYQLKESGLLTGGGDKNQQAERLGAKQPYSIKIGDTWYAFNRMDPLGLFFGLAADIADISGQVDVQEGDEIAAMAVLALQRNIVSKSYLKGITDLMNVVTDPERYSQGFLNRMVTMFVPFVSLLGTAAQVDDPFIKEVWTATDAIKARIPGLSKTVPNHVNLLGEEVKYTDGWGPDFASPIKQMPDKPVSPLAEEIGNLNIDLKHPPRTLSVVEGAPGVDLTPEQYTRYMKAAGGKFKEIGEQLVKSPVYTSASSVPNDVDPDYVGGKEFLIRKAYHAALKYGRDVLIMEDKALAHKAQQTKLNKMRVFMGMKPVPIND